MEIESLCPHLESILFHCFYGCFVFFKARHGSRNKGYTTLKVVGTRLKRVLIYSKIDNATLCSLPWTRVVNFISKGTTFCSYVPVSVSVSAQDGIVALGKAHTRSAPSLSSLPKVALETVPIFVWLNTDRSRPWRVECRPLPFSTPLSFRRSML